MFEKIIKYWNIGTVLLLLLGIGWIWISSVPDGSTSNNGLVYAPRSGFRAPEIDLQTIDGNSINLTDLRGQVVLINFWASWCPPCQAEMSSMQKIYEDYRDQGFTILAINSTLQDKLPSVIDFVTKHDLTFPILLDNSGESISAYLVEALPTSFFVDKEGIIQEVIIGGPMPEALLRERVEKLLEKE